MRFTLLFVAILAMISCSMQQAFKPTDSSFLELKKKYEVLDDMLPSSGKSMESIRVTLFIKVNSATPELIERLNSKELRKVVDYLRDDQQKFDYLKNGTLKQRALLKAVNEYVDSISDYQEDLEDYEKSNSLWSKLTSFCKPKLILLI